MSAESPEVRAAIIATVLRVVAETPDSVAYGSLFDAAQFATGLPEEEVGQLILHATSVLILAGLLKCNQYNEAAGQIIYCADTRVSSGERLLGYVWREELPRDEREDDDPVLRPR